MTNSANPLSKHFRQPSLYVKPPSGGKYWANGSLELTATGDMAVYPMTTKDEIILRTPDALVNGTSVVQVIESCCPSIKNAWDMPSIDVDSTLIAIRIASYGNKMPMDAKCPECGEENEYDLELQNIMANIESPNYDKTVKTDDGLVIKLKPMSYSQVSKSGVVTLEEEKLIQALANPDLSEEVRKSEYDKHVQKMIDLNTENLSYCTESITADEQVVTEFEFIKEFYENADASVIRKVRILIDEFVKVAGIKPQDAVCSECGHKFQMNVEFDYSNFFDKGF